MILAGFLILGLADGFVAYACPVSYMLTEFSLVSHFYLIGTLVFLYNKETLTRILGGLLAGLVWAFFFQGSFPFDPLFYVLAGWLCGKARFWSNSSRFSWLFFLLFALAYDVIPWIWLWIFTPYNASFLVWLYRMETFSVLLNIVTLYAVRYAADVMDRYFKIVRVRQAREDKKKLARMRVSSHAPD